MEQLQRCRIVQYESFFICTAFTLVVDDFGIKYCTREDALHLVSTLELLYPIKIDWTGEQYLGFAFVGSCRLGFDARPSVEILSCAWLLAIRIPPMDCRNRQTVAASPA